MKSRASRRKKEIYSVLVFRLPEETSQSRIVGRSKSSNACTLVCIKTAENITRQAVRLPDPKRRKAYHTQRANLMKYGTVDNSDNVHHNIKVRLSTKLFDVFATSIVEGNLTHLESTRKIANEDMQKFTIPNGIVACGKNIQEIDFCKIGGNMSLLMPKFLRMAINDKRLHSLPVVFFIIIAYERSVLLAYERRTKTLTLFDSHSHDEHGAIIASASLGDINVFCRWICSNIYKESNTGYHRACGSKHSHDYEISVVQFIGQPTRGDCVKAKAITVEPQMRLFSRDSGKEEEFYGNETHAPGGHEVASEETLKQVYEEHNYC